MIQIKLAQVEEEFKSFSSKGRNKQELDGRLIEEELLKSEKESRQKIRALNNLRSENKKLKEEVNAQRDKRVISCNIYKNFEKQIHTWEEKYKDLLIQRKVSEIALERLIGKFTEIKKKLEKGYYNNNISQINCSPSQIDRKLPRSTERKLIRLFTMKNFEDSQKKEINTTK